MSIFDRLRKDKPEAESDDQPVAPMGRSGRGHAEGFLELEERNPALQHPRSHETFDRMYRGDGDCRQALQLSVNPLVSGTWTVEPHGGREAEDRDIEVAADLHWALFDFMTPNLIGHLAEFLPVLFRSGFTPGELTWAATQRDGRDLIAPAAIGLRLPRSIWRWFQHGDTLTGIEQYLPAGGAVVFNEGYSDYGGGAAGDNGNGPGKVIYQRNELVYYRVGAEGDNWEGVSLLRPAYKHWFFKDLIERIDAMAQEREALGVPVVYPPASATPDQLDAMEAILKELRSNEQGYLIMPGMKAGDGAPDGTGWLMELMGFDRQGSGRDPQPSLEYHTNKIAAAFIAEFMRLGHGSSGSRATAQTQADPFKVSIEALATIIENELHTSITVPFCAYNYSDVKDPPRIRMSLVDETSLTELADFVMKLVQVGAIIADPVLEDFMRQRADVPAADPAAVKARGDDDEMVRLQIVGGNVQPTPKDEADAKAALEQAKVAPPAFGGGGGGAVKPGAGKPPAKSAKKTGAAKGPGGAGGGAPRGPAKSLDGLGMAERFPRARDADLNVDLDGLAESFDSMGRAFVAAAGHHVLDLAVADNDATAGALRGAVHQRLLECYGEGADHVADELQRQGYAPAGAQLDRGARDRNGAIDARADAVVSRVRQAVNEAKRGQDLAHGNEGMAQAAGERAGMRALEQGGRRHGVAALLHGRHDQARALDDSAPEQELLATYTSVLDDHRCAQCDMADDGVARKLDDPVRQEHMPPNPHCDSLASGDNLCRCFETYEFADAVR